jgi:putative tricarboxylic transport membrane protein
LKQGDRISAIFFLALSLFVCGHAAQIGIGSLQQPGPGLMVFGSGAGVGLLALWLLVHSSLYKAGQHTVPAEESPLRKGPFLLLCASLFIYTLAASRLGFLIATFLFIIFVFRLVESEPWWRTLLKAVLITVGNYLLFVIWLGLSLPKGILPW